MQVRIREEWKKILQPTFDAPYFQQLSARLRQEIQQGQVIYPAGKNLFAAFEYCAPSDIKVVLLGQDPYHGPGQAHGLSFSVPKEVAPPPSLRNIFKELKTDLGLRDMPSCGDLTSWAKQGVLLLNASLSVQSGKPMSHSQIGWNIFTDFVIEQISSLPQPIVFLLWGKFAQSKKHFVHLPQHLVLCTAHPSPLSAYNGFFGSRPFSKANEWLMQHGSAPIVWQLPDTF